MGTLLTISKCSGQQPCARCSKKGLSTCQYVASTHVTKESMRAEINDLTKYRDLSEQILSSLASGGRPDVIIQQLQDKVQLEDIAKALEQLPIPDEQANSDHPLDTLDVSNNKTTQDTKFQSATYPIYKLLVVSPHSMSSSPDHIDGSEGSSLHNSEGQSRIMKGEQSDRKVTKDSSGRFCCGRSDCTADVKYFNKMSDWR